MSRHLPLWLATLGFLLGALSRPALAEPAHEEVRIVSSAGAGRSEAGDHRGTFLAEVVGKAREMLDIDTVAISGIEDFRYLTIGRWRVPGHFIGLRRPLGERALHNDLEIVSEHRLGSSWLLSGTAGDRGNVAVMVSWVFSEAPDHP
jgi:hypothetical protein